MTCDQPAADALSKQHPAASVGLGDFHAAVGDWEHAAADYVNALAGGLAAPSDLLRIAAALQSAGRTKQAVPFLARASASTPSDTYLSMSVAALQAWFGQAEDFADSRRRLLAHAGASKKADAAERAAKSCSLLPSTDRAELDAAVALGFQAVALNKDSVWIPFSFLALGMAEYRAGQFDEADATLTTAIKHAIDHPNEARYDKIVDRTASFYRALCLFRRGRPDEARALAIVAEAKMKPLPADEQNPLVGGNDWDDLILWLACKEAKALMQFDKPPAAPTPPGGN